MKAKTTIRRIGSLFFLAIFLWFYSVKDIHDIVHKDDVHCHIKDAKHIHQGEHHCPICDFTFPYFDDAIPHIGVPSDNSFVSVLNFYTTQTVLSKTVSLSSPRAPPVVA